MLSHTRMGVPYEYTHMGRRPIRVWANIRIWGRTSIIELRTNFLQKLALKNCFYKIVCYQNLEPYGSYLYYLIIVTFQAKTSLVRT